VTGYYVYLNDVALTDDDDFIPAQRIDPARLQLRVSSTMPPATTRRGRRHVSVTTA